jgi:RNA polymerase sigma-70 factor, ECF subfamily
VDALGEEFVHGAVAADGVQPRPSIDDVEEELARLLKSRSVAAWETLFERHFDRVYRYALGRLFSRESAEDVAAATFDRALSMIDSYSYRGRPVLAWLYGIARNVVNETRRSQMRQRATELLDSFLNRENGHGASNRLAPMEDDGTNALVSRMDLQQALRDLTEIQREVVLLRYFAGLTAAEAGQVIGRPETAVYALQARALAALRRQLT